MQRQSTCFHCRTAAKVTGHKRATGPDVIVVLRPAQITSTRPGARISVVPRLTAEGKIAILNIKNSEALGPSLVRLRKTDLANKNLMRHNQIRKEIAQSESRAVVIEKYFSFNFLLLLLHYKNGGMQRSRPHHYKCEELSDKCAETPHR